MGGFVRQRLHCVDSRVGEVKPHPLGEVMHDEGLGKVIPFESPPIGAGPFFLHFECFVFVSRILRRMSDRPIFGDSILRNTGFTCLVHSYRVYRFLWWFLRFLLWIVMPQLRQQLYAIRLVAFGTSWRPQPPYGVVVAVVGSCRFRNDSFRSRSCNDTY